MKRAGHARDVRLDGAAVAARLGVTPRHVARLVAQGRFPAPHYVADLRRWWLSEVVAWEGAATTSTAPAALRRGAANLRHGPQAGGAP